MAPEPRSSGGPEPAAPVPGQTDRAASPERIPVYFQWMPSSFFGWGVYAINLMLSWASDPEIVPICSGPIVESKIVLDDAARRSIADILERSRQFRAQLEPFAGKVANIPRLVLHSIGNDFNPACPSAHNVLLMGKSTVGVIFNEVTTLSAEARERAARYQLFVAGSRWNAATLQDAGLGPVATVLQGIDPALFHPGPRTGRFGDRFVVFSGGKLEYRKGQDLVLLAFREFAARHPEALLVTAWHCPWPALAKSLALNPAIAPVPFAADGTPALADWAEANGIKRDNFLDLGTVPNAQMPPLLREVDAALFPNRCEAGTNLVAMECMACGVPTVLAANSGQLDLVGDGRALPLQRQRKVSELRTHDISTEGWGESDIAEMVEALESLWRDREAARAMGAKAAAFMREMSWRNQMAKLKEVLRPYIV
jgi:glycosyltransferase involved in cell wall biosynthesis